ncbi:MAG: riboflavin synthase [Bacillota bacterium]
MFTGLVEELGTMRTIRKGPNSAVLTVEGPGVLDDVKLGDSIAVNGVCLTVVEFTREAFTVEVMAETLARTNLGQLKPGSRVNLERASRLGDRLGGHLVSGHIDGVGTVSRRQPLDIAIIYEIQAPEGVLKYIIPKGSVAVDGISLTVVDCFPGYFTVSVIPHTAGKTTLAVKQAGEQVNLEADMIAKYIERLLEAHGGKNEQKSRITPDFLTQHGFL